MPATCFSILPPLLHVVVEVRNQGAGECILLFVAGGGGGVTFSTCCLCYDIKALELC